ncbi:LysR family transcriptional regulator [Noviherbaspirillum denitrificans]|uniref:LysR family transcriptional regulator n=1 Tax=Noviherbaspirillum denitrificans TaxID=1968433 RepID=A0A254TIP4_9BURK|nr:LysR family transcriptional regulator [Noviherbaspirillum denitrificans]OWW21212.1 LysR family transcriptional regulator [Noviherbaspirillum denitrificans]
MDRLHFMTIFLAVADEESFAGAARKMGMSPPAVTRAISALEEHLGARLFNRTTRAVRLTDAGMRYLDDVRRIVTAVEEAEAAAAGINAEPRGRLTVTAPVLFGKMFITPAIVDFLAAYPKVDVSAHFFDHVVSLVDEGIDVGIRIGDLPDSSIKAIKVGTVRRVLCASPTYLKQHGLPRTPADLAHHTLIASTGITQTSEWKFHEGSNAAQVRISPRLVVTSNDSAIEAAARGLGITRLLSYQIAPYLASGELTILLSQYEPPTIPVHVIHREGVRAAAKVRSFVDYVVERLKNDKALN